MSDDPNKKPDDAEDSQEGQEEGEETLSEEELEDATGGARPAFVREASPVRVN